MRRSTSTDDSSLELLLDTITNTFGGVLFISILVVLLLQFRGSSFAVEVPDSETKAEMVSLQLQLDRETARLEEVLEAIESNKEVKEMLAGSLDPSDLAMVEALQKKQESLFQRRDSMLQDLANIQKEINEKAAKFNDNHELASEISQIQRQTSRVEELIEKTINEQKKARQAILDKKNTPTQRDTPLPKITATNKIPCIVLVQNDELVVVSRNGQINLGHLVRVSDGQIVKSSSEQYNVRRGTGLDLSQASNLRARLRQVLGSTVTPRRYYLQIAIYDNAFDHWENLRIAIVGGESGGATSGTSERSSEGFRYRLIPFVTNQKIHFTGTASGAQ